VYQLMRKQNHELEDLFAFKNLGRVNVPAEAKPRSSRRIWSREFLPADGSASQLGRPIEPSDDEKPGATPVVVISDGLLDAAVQPLALGIGKTMAGEPGERDHCRRQIRRDSLARRGRRVLGTLYAVQRAAAVFPYRNEPSC